MNYEPLAGIISNAALLLALWVIYEATFLNISISPRLKKIKAGFCNSSIKMIVKE